LPPDINEAVEINKSLTALSDVMQALSEHSNHIPFRNSILTSYLRDSLRGDAKTQMISCISPDIFTKDESIRTLNFS